MPPTITAFENSPDRGRGLARDMRGRWALEEVGEPYQVRLLSFKALKEPSHRALQPFGQIPTYEDGTIALFETGAIVLHIAERYAGLLPPAPERRARAIAWMFTAVSTIEPVIVERETAFFTERDEPWFEHRLAQILKRIRSRLGDLSASLGEAEWLDGTFSAGDLMVIDVLRRAKTAKLLDEFPNLANLVARGEERPAFQRAFAAQYAVFKAASAST